MEVESDLEVFEMKQEIVSLQTKIENSESEKLTSNAETLLIVNVTSLLLDEGVIFKKVIGKGWRNSVMQRRIYGRLTKSAKKEAEDWARQTKRTLGKTWV